MELRAFDCAAHIKARGEATEAEIINVFGSRESFERLLESANARQKIISTDRNWYFSAFRDLWLAS